MAKFYEINPDYFNAFDINLMDDQGYWRERIKLEGKVILDNPDYQEFVVARRAAKGIINAQHDEDYFAEVRISADHAEERKHKAYRTDYSTYMHIEHLKRIEERAANQKSGRGAVTNQDLEELAIVEKELQDANRKLALAQKAVDEFLITSGLSKKPKELEKFRAEYDRRREDIEAEKERRRLFRAKEAVRELEAEDFKRRFIAKLEKVARENIGEITDNAREAFDKGQSYTVNGVTLTNEKDLRKYLNSLKAVRDLAVENATSLTKPSFDKEVFGDFAELEVWHKTAFARYQALATPKTYSSETGFSPEIETLIDLESEKEAAEDVVFAVEAKKDYTMQWVDYRHKVDDRYIYEYHEQFHKSQRAGNALAVVGTILTIGATAAALVLSGGAILPALITFGATAAASVVGTIEGSIAIERRNIEKLRKKWWPIWFPKRQKDPTPQEITPEEELVLDPKKHPCPEPPHRKRKTKSKGKGKGRGNGKGKSNSLIVAPTKTVTVFGKQVVVRDAFEEENSEDELQRPTINAYKLELKSKILAILGKHLEDMEKHGITDEDERYKIIQKAINSQTKDFSKLKKLVDNEIGCVSVDLLDEEASATTIKKLEDAFERLELRLQDVMEDLASYNECYAEISSMNRISSKLVSKHSVEESEPSVTSVADEYSSEIFADEAAILETSEDEFIEDDEEGLTDGPKDDSNEEGEDKAK